MAFRALTRTNPAHLRHCFRAIPQCSVTRIRWASQAALDPDVVDPGMNGGYQNPPPQKRAMRDPYGDWWDKQERRNFGEPVHEDNDILTVFSPEPYTHASPGRAGLHLGVFILAVLGLCGAVHQLYPDRPSAPRQLAGDLESELGGSSAVTMKNETSEKETEEA